MKPRILRRSSAGLLPEVRVAWCSATAGCLGAVCGCWPAVRAVVPLAVPAAGAAAAWCCRCVVVQVSDAPALYCVLAPACCVRAVSVPPACSSSRLVLPHTVCAPARVLCPAVGSLSAVPRVRAGCVCARATCRPPSRGVPPASSCPWLVCVGTEARVWGQRARGEGQAGRWSPWGCLRGGAVPPGVRPRRGVSAPRGTAVGGAGVVPRLSSRRWAVAVAWGC
jgi:hypothetical protein